MESVLLWRSRRSIVLNLPALEATIRSYWFLLTPPRTDRLAW